MADVALIGNPNTGKTTLFNSLTDKYAFVGNWTGVTVEKKVGTLKDSDIQVVDLPGTYSLNPLTKDEAVVTNYLLANRPDLILNITNASQLKRNLLLTIEVLERGLPTILILNMIDDLRRSGQTYDLDLLSQRLGCQVTTTNARGHQGISQLRQQIINYQDVAHHRLQLDYPPMLKQAIRQATEALQDDYHYDNATARWLAINFIDQSRAIRAYAKSHQLAPLLKQAAYYDAQKFSKQIYETRLTFIEQLLKDAAQSAVSNEPQLTSKIDKVVTNPILGLPIFAGIF